MSPLVEQVLNWGRTQRPEIGQNVVDLAGIFQAEKLRKELRREYLKRNETGRQIVGDFKRGYEMLFGSERIGVAGPGQFKVYYRCLAPVPSSVAIPFMGEPVPSEEWTDDYGILPQF